MQSLRPRLAAAALALAVAPFAANATPVVGGDLLVLRTGDATINVGAVPVYIDEYTTAGAFVQSFMAPSTGASALIQSFNTTTEGNINLSTDGNYLVFVGYRKDAGAAAGGSTDAAATTPRVIGRLTLANGTIDTSTVIETTVGAPDLFDKSSVRGVASTDGQHFWVSGTSNPTTTGGLVYTNGFGASAVSTLLQGQNYRGITIAGGNLWASRASTIHNLTGLPTASPITTPTAFSSLSSGQNYESITLLDLNPAVPGVDTAYAPNSTQGGIEKWYFDTTQNKWVKAGLITTTTAAVVLNLTAGTPVFDAASGNYSVPLYFTSTPGNPATTASVIDTVTDVSAFGAAPTGTISTIVTAATSTGFRGIVQVQTPGDVTGDFRLDADDFVAIDLFVAQKGLGGASASRQSGDLNSDGVVDAMDYLMLDTAWGKKQGSLSPDFLSDRLTEFGPDYVAALTAAVPEPTSLLAACGLTLPLLSRRRRRA